MFQASYICKFLKHLVKPLLHTFLFVTSTYGLADKLNHIAEGLVTSSRSGYLAQGSQINKVFYGYHQYLSADRLQETMPYQDQTGQRS